MARIPGLATMVWPEARATRFRWCGDYRLLLRMSARVRCAYGDPMFW